MTVPALLGLEAVLYLKCPHPHFQATAHQRPPAPKCFIRGITYPLPGEILISTVWAGPWESAILTSTSADSGDWESQGEQDTSPGDTVSVLQCLRKRLDKVSELSPQRRLPAMSVFPAVTAGGNSGLCAFYKPAEPPRVPS